MKKLYIAEKPSVAQEFAKALKIRAARKDGYLEGEEAVVTWCVGHLVTMSYPEIYDASYKKWSLATLPFLPENFLYEVIPATKKQFKVVSTLLNRKDIDVIYVCTDSGRKENIFTAWWSRKHMFRARKGCVCGSILRQKKKSYTGLRQQKIFPHTIILQVPLICVQKRII